MWKHKSFKGKYKSRYSWVIEKKTNAVKRMFVLSKGMDQEFFESWQDAKSQGWSKCQS